MVVQVPAYIRYRNKTNNILFVRRYPIALFLHPSQAKAVFIFWIAH